MAAGIRAQVAVYHLHTSLMSLQDQLYLVNPPPVQTPPPGATLTPPPPTAPAPAALPASFLRRLANNFIDGIAVAFLVYPLVFLVSLLLGVSQDEAVETGNIAAVVAIALVSIIVPPLYFFVCEWRWQRTAGKLATATKVVDYAGGKLSAGRAFLRTICRYIPFDALSFLFSSYPRGWHDKVSGTLVVPTDASPEAVAAMDRGAATKVKGPHRWAVVLLSVLALLPLLCIPFFMFITAMLFMNGFSEGGSMGGDRAESVLAP